MKEFFEKAKRQGHPLRPLHEFLAKEEKSEQAEQYDRMRFVGYVLDIGYDTVTIITSDPYKEAVGGIPRNSLLIMVPASLDRFLPHFTLLRVLESAPTPLSSEVQQTYFELQKKSMPELDVFTQSELQWGALKTGVLGMFYPHPENGDEVEFSGDINNFVSAHRYRVYAPDDDLLDLVVNSLVPLEDRFHIGELRITENRLPLPDRNLPNVGVFVSTRDFVGARTAMFGKTRLGKSNIVKLIAESIIEATGRSRNVGQLIFDVNGEYANDNPQDESRSLRSGHTERCVVYALTEKKGTESKPLKLNFFEHPDRSLRVLSNLLTTAGRNSIYVERFRGSEVPALDSLEDLPFNQKIRAKRRILIYWAILHKAGFASEVKALRGKLPLGNSLDPAFSEELRAKLYSRDSVPQIHTLDNVVDEFERLADFNHNYPGDKSLKSTGSGDPLLDSNDEALLGFLKPPVGAGPAMIQRFRIYHDKNAGNFSQEILDELELGSVVILDLGNADPEVMAYFSEELTTEVLSHQVLKFTNNELENHFIQLYFEEAHNLFPVREQDTLDIYRRIAKEGAKYQIGMVYSTQSVSTINKDLIGQTENFFILHLSSRDEVDALARVNVAYESLKDDILRARTRGYARMLTRSHRFVVSVQARKFVPTQEEM